MTERDFEPLWLEIVILCQKHGMELREDGRNVHDQLKEFLGSRLSGDSLRDEFAAAASPAIIRQCHGDTLRDNETKEQMFARKAYEVADAMLKARNS